MDRGILVMIDKVIARSPRHPGANHLNIHIREASAEPGKATASADLLRDLIPGAGHLVHMPSHIYIRTGRYADGILANQKLSPPMRTTSVPVVPRNLSACLLSAQLPFLLGLRADVWTWSIGIGSVAYPRVENGSQSHGHPGLADVAALLCDSVVFNGAVQSVG